MQLTRSKRFKRDYKKLPLDIQKRTDKKLLFFIEDPSHPSLRIKRTQKRKNMFEGSITKNYRFFFIIEGGRYTLLKVGTHDILDKL